MSNISVEVAPEPGGWKVSRIETWIGRADSARKQVDVLTHRRRKKTAMLVGTGAAMALGCELRVKNKRGEYTTEGSSFGHDRRDVKG